MNRFKQNILLILAILFCFNIIVNAQYSSAKNGINKVLKDKFFESAVVGIDAYDLTAKRSVYTYKSNLLLHPASTNKIITSVAGLLYLGPNYEFKTSVYHTGSIIDSICYGDLFIVGGADPDFNSYNLDTLVMAIKNFGIKEIAGNLFGDVSMLDSVYWGQGWMWDDDPGLSAAYITPLTINDNGIKIYYQPSFTDKTVQTELKYKTNTISITNNAITSVLDTSTFKITRNWMTQKNEITISGELPYDKKYDSTGVNFIHPEFHFLDLAEEKLQQNGIKLNGFVDTLKMPEGTKHIYTNGRKFRHIIDNMNKESDNLSAELTLRTIGYEAEGKRATYGEGLKQIYNMLYGLGYKKYDFRIVDGSGLSHYNLVTPKQLTDLLKYIYKNNVELYEILYNSFPIAGVNGTLEKRMTKGNAYKNVRAKTGTLSGVSCLTGYLTTKNKHTVAFTIMIQNHVNSTKKARKLQDKICEILVGIK